MSDFFKEKLVTREQEHTVLCSGAIHTSALNVRL